MMNKVEKPHIDIRILAATPTFKGLGPEALRDVVASCTVHSFGPGQTLFRRGEPYKHSLFIVYEGRVELRQPGGRIGRFGAGAVLALSNYLDEEPYASTAMALDPSVVLELPAAKMEQLEAEHAPLADAIYHSIAERIRLSSAGTHAISGALAQPVRAAMKTPLSACRPDVTLRDAFVTMQERKIGSLGVLTDDDELAGIITYSGLSDAMISHAASPDSTVGDNACETARTIAPEALLWQAEEALHRYGVKYLVVVENERPIGIISQSDILKALVTHTPTLLVQAKDATDLDTLHELNGEIYHVAREARDTNRLASRAVLVISDAHLALQHRCVELTLAEMPSHPPRAFALLIMGSGGRREMLFNPDQDNGIVITDEPGPLSAAEQGWFERFTHRLNDNLDRIGYILCPGDIMARNPMFRKTLVQWREQITHMVRRPTEKAARWSNIVFDFETLYGDSSLTHELRAHVLAEIQNHTALLGFMVEDDAEGRPPLGLFNRLITTGEGERKGKIDIKRNGLRIIADAARIYALSAGISSCNTNDRLQALVRQGVLSADLVASVTAAYEELLDLLLSHQIAQQEAGEKPDKLIAPDELSARALDGLRVAMRAVKRFQDQLQGHFGRAAF